MSFGRALATGASTLAVGGCALLVVAMSTGDTSGHPVATTPTPSAAAELPGPEAWTPYAAAAPSSAASPSTSAAPTHPSTVSTPTAPPSAAPASVSRAAPPAAATQQRAPAPAPAPAVPAPVRGVSLPVGGTTANATEVITVEASSYSSTTATLQAWRKAPGGGWLRVGPAVLAHVGADGLTTAPSESKSATPIGSFTLTQAFGALANPGTPIPYFQTTSGDWWISQSGPLYNTHQRCYSGCSFTQGSPNEHLMYETPYYNYAVVIDYNTANSPTGVRQGAGSAFFLHVTDGTPTAGCVAIPQYNLVSIMRWLSPGDHPRILIGVA